MTLGVLRTNKMGLMTFTILLLLVAGGFNTGLVSGETFSSYDGMEKEEKYWKPEIYGSVSTSTTFLNDQYESDNDVDSILSFSNSVNSIYLENNDSRIENQVVDLSESSFGNHLDSGESWTTDGTTDGDIAAVGGKNYWIINGSTSPTHEESSNEGTGASATSTTFVSPASGGYKYVSTIYNDADTDTGAEWESLKQTLSSDSSLTNVNNEIDADTYLYIQGSIKLTFDNTTANGGKGNNAYIGLVVGDGSQNYLLAFSVTDTVAPMLQASGYSTTTGNWVEALDGQVETTGSSPFGYTGSQIYPVKTSAASGTTYEFGLFFNIQDRINQDDEAADRITISQIVGFVMGVGGYYVDSADGRQATFSIANMLLVDNANNGALYESTDTDDTTEQKTNNYLNGTLLSLSEEDDYPLINGFEFAFDLPINRLTLSSFDYIIEPTEHELLYGLDGGYDSDGVFGRTSTFSTKIASEEPFSEPSTYYGNFSNIDDDSYLIDIYFDGEDMFEEDGDMKSGWSMEDGSTFNEISDVYDADLSGDIKITPKTAIGSESSYSIEVVMDVGETIVGDLVADQSGNAFDSLWDGILAGLASIGIVWGARSLRQRKIKRANQ